MAPDAVQVQVQLVLRLALGQVFLGSAFAKLRDPSVFVARGAGVASVAASAKTALRRIAGERRRLCVPAE